ncbi:MAG: Ldh family oxidoreductase [Actinobacteria bacterium]|nr:Ldh family oxidoreductase [Actinomycetota bacterium]
MSASATPPPARLSLDEVFDLSYRMLRASGASHLQAEPTARSIRDSEAEGLRPIGLSYLPTYCDHVHCGKVLGDAVPSVSVPRAATVVVDAGLGFSHPAFEAGAPALVDATRACGVGLMAITHSYSAGVLGWFVEHLAEQGLVALMFANSSSLMAPAGGRRPFFGTNPLAWAAPRAGGAPVVADLSSSAVAWVKVNAAAQAGEDIPLGWAIDADGNPTTDARAALAGAMVPAAGHKGSALALLVDIMSGGVAGSHFSFEASGFGGTAGGPPDVGQVLLAIDPTATMGPGFVDRIETELQALAAEDGARLPGDARLASRRHTAEHGVEVPADLMALLTEYAEHGSPAVADD